MSPVCPDAAGPSTFGGGGRRLRFPALGVQAQQRRQAVRQLLLCRVLTWVPGRKKVAGQLLELSLRSELRINLLRSDRELFHCFLFLRHTHTHKKNHLESSMVLSQVFPERVLDWASEYVGARSENSDNAPEKATFGFSSKPLTLEPPV